MTSKPKVLKAGTRVVFTQQSGNDRIDPTVHIIESSEAHEGHIFYRLVGLKGSLFVRQSLATTKPGCAYIHAEATQ